MLFRFCKLILLPMNRYFIVSFNARRKLKNISDEDLALQFAANKDDIILNEFFDRYVHLVFALCMKHFKHEEKAKDTTMVIFEALGEKLLKFEIQNFKSWLCTVARNACLMELRKKKHEISTEQVEIFHHYDMENQEEVHLFNDENRREDDLMVYLHKLNDNQRVCLDLMYFQNKSYKEIAVETGFSLKEVKSYIQNGKRNLRNFMKLGDEE